MPVRSGRVVLTPRAEKPYKVILDHHPSGSSEHPVSSVREGEEFIRERLPGALPQAVMEDWHI